MDLSRTSTMLLRSLLDGGDDHSWSEFERRYRPVILAVARRLGFEGSDAEDVAQETCVAFLEDFRAGKYDPAKGRLGAWIAGIARNRARARWQSRSPEAGARGESVLGEVPGADEFERTWADEANAHIVAEAFHSLRRGSEIAERSVRAFEATELEGRTVAEVASELAMSADAIYTARKRCRERLREVAVTLRHVYEL